MKNIIASLIFLLLIFQGSRAQSPILVSEETLGFGNSTMPAYSVTIPEADYEKTQKEWIKLLESGTKSKVVTENGQMSIFGAKLKSVSENPVNVYSTLTKQDSSVIIKAAVELEKDHYASGAEYSSLREYLMDFARDQYLAVVDEQLDNQKKILRDLKKDVKSLDRDESGMKKSVKSNDKLISSEQEKIASYNDELSRVSADIDRLQSGGMGSKDMSDTGSSSLKDLKKEQKKLDKSIKKSEKIISKAERKVDKGQRDIADNSGDQADAKNRLEEQEAIVRQYEAKRDAVKRFK